MSGYSDFLFAFLGSALFWLTVAGISIRALKVDFRRVEDYLREFYAKADSLDFSALKMADVLVGKLLSSIYGKSFRQTFFVTLVACLVTLSFISSHFFLDWQKEGERVDAVILKTIESVDIQYFLLINSENGRRSLSYAFEQMSAGKGGVYFSHNDMRSQELRRAFENFYPHYLNYISEHGLTYFDALDRYFGKAYSNPHWQRAQKVQMFFAVLLTLAGATAIDFAAVILTMQFYKTIKSDRNLSLLYLALIVGCFVISEAQYTAFSNGREALVFLVIMFLFFSVLLMALSVFVLSYILSLRLIFRWAAVLLGALVVGGLIIIFGADVILDPIIRLYEECRNIAIVIAQGVSREAIVVGMVSVYPLILIASLFVVAILCKWCFAVVKNVFLGQVYGASVLSGATFFFGFLTTIISSTAVAYTLIKALVS